MKEEKKVTHVISQIFVRFAQVFDIDAHGSLCNELQTRVPDVGEKLVVQGFFDGGSEAGVELQHQVQQIYSGRIRARIHVFKILKLFP
jgi:hypothetical protein